MMASRGKCTIAEQRETSARPGTFLAWEAVGNGLDDPRKVDKMEFIEK
jgi:hypothetical protein